MFISQVFLLSSRGDKLVFKDYRQDVPRNSDEIFFRKLKFWDGTCHQAPTGDCPPFFSEKGIQFAFVRRGPLIVAATTRHNVSPSLLSETLNRICKVLKDYLGVLNEESIRKNFVMCYEILDEVIDVGVIQELTSERLRANIFNEPIAVEREPEVIPDKGNSGIVGMIRRGTELVGGERTRNAGATQLSILAGSKQRKNEIYIDIIERLNVVLNATGGVVTSEVDGAIIMKSFLAGSPEMHLGLNEDLVVGRSDARGKYSSVCLDSVNFHEAADYSRFESERTIVMNPPDGEFTVMNYRMTGEFPMPFRIVPSLELQSTYKAELTLRVRADIAAGVTGVQCVLRVPLPKSTTSVGVELGIGAKGQSYEYRTGDRFVSWHLAKFAGGTEEVCKIRISTGAPITPATRKEIGPISMGFEVPMHNVSGLAIKFLRIEERSQSYNPQRWVRNVTQASSYVCRTS